MSYLAGCLTLIALAAAAVVLGGREHLLVCPASGECFDGGSRHAWTTASSVAAVLAGCAVLALLVTRGRPAVAPPLLAVVAIAAAVVGA